MEIKTFSRIWAALLLLTTPFTMMAQKESALKEKVNKADNFITRIARSHFDSTYVSLPQHRWMVFASGNGSYNKFHLRVPMPGIVEGMGLEGNPVFGDRDIYTYDMDLHSSTQSASVGVGYRTLRLKYTFNIGKVNDQQISIESLGARFGFLVDYRHTKKMKGDMYDPSDGVDAWIENKTSQASEPMTASDVIKAGTSSIDKSYNNFTLLHDDVMDHADLRRNKPTVCSKWNTSVAILSGDAMLIDAYQTISQVDSPAFSLIINTFTKTAMEVCEGQQYDMDFETQEEVSVDQYMEMIRLKTAVLIAASIKIGALIGGATDAETEILYNFGINMGLAFQLQDDLLDTYGDETTFGKAIGGDIVENKKTFLLITALERATTTQKRELTKWLEAVSPKREQKIEAVRNIYDQIGVKALTEQRINELQNEAMARLREMDISAEGKRFFADFADSIFKRIR